MYNRVIYLLISVLSLLLPAFIFFLFDTHEVVFVSFIKLFFIYLVYFLVSVWFHLMLSSFHNGGIFGRIYPFFGIFTLFYKPINTSLGRFYLKWSGDNFTRLSVFRQNMLTFEYSFEVTYDGSIYRLKEAIKSNIDFIYEDEISKLNRKESLKEWGGDIDMPSGRKVNVF